MRLLATSLTICAFALSLAACDSGGDYEMLVSESDTPTAELGPEVGPNGTALDAPEDVDPATAR